MSTDSADYERFSKLTSVNDALRRLGDECEAEVDALKAELERIEGERDALAAIKPTPGCPCWCCHSLRIHSEAVEAALGHTTEGAEP